MKSVDSPGISSRNPAHLNNCAGRLQIARVGVGYEWESTIAHTEGTLKARKGIIEVHNVDLCSRI